MKKIILGSLLMLSVPCFADNSTGLYSGTYPGPWSTAATQLLNSTSTWTGIQTINNLYAPNFGTSAESCGASPSATASANTTAIQKALNKTGLVTLNTCGTYSINQTLVIPSSTTLQMSPCVSLQLAAGSNTNMIVNNAFNNRGYLTGTYTYNGSGISGCTTKGPFNNTEFVEFTSSNGVGGFGYISIAGGIPTGPVTLFNPGGFYITPPTTGMLTDVNGSTQGVCTVGNTTGSFPTFSGGQVAPNTLNLVGISTGTGNEVTVNWPGNLPATIVPGQTNIAIFGKNAPSVFSGVFPIENVFTSSFTYRSMYIPQAVSSGVVTAQIADQNITIDGVTLDYNWPNQNHTFGVNGTMNGIAMILGVAQNTHVKNLNFANPTQNDMATAMLRDAFISDCVDASTTTGFQTAGIIRQFVKNIGPEFNVKYSNISIRGNDDGLSFMNYEGDNYQDDAFSQGDVINAGFDTIDRFNMNTTNGSSGLIMFFPGATFKMSGVYAKNISGIINPAYNTVCVGVSGVMKSSVTPTGFDGLEVDNVTGNCTRSFSIIEGDGLAWKPNHITLDHIYCNQTNISAGDNTQACIYEDQYTSPAIFDINNMVVGDGQLANTTIPNYIWIDGGAGVLNIRNANLNASSAPNDPGRLIDLTATSNVSRVNISGLYQPYGDRVMTVNPGNSNTPHVDIRDSFIKSTCGIIAASAVRATFDNITSPDGMSNGLMRVDEGDATTGFNITASFSNNQLGGSSIYHSFAGGGAQSVGYYMFDGGGNVGSALTPLSGANLSMNLGSPLRNAIPAASIVNALVPFYQGVTVPCSNCAAGSAICQSTGTLKSQWASIASTATVCQ